jgi:hypothetical protein
MQHFSNPAHGRSDGAAALGDPLAPIIDLLDEAHRELTVPDLAAVLLEVDQLAAVLDASRAPSLRPDQAMTGSDPRLTPAGRAYRSTAAERFCECVGGPHSPGELTNLGTRLEAYIEEVAARPTGSAIPA